MIGCAAPPVPLHGPGVRSIVHHPDRRIPEQLLPDDRIVTVVRNETLTVYDSPPASPADALRRAMVPDPPTAIAIVRVTDATASLTEDQSWVVTKLRLVVQDVLKHATPNDALRAGDVVNATMGGGVVRIGGVTVRAEPAVTFSFNQRYLLALTQPDDRGRRELASDLAFSVDERERISPIYPYASYLSGVSLGDVRKAVLLPQ